jgi:hypothetical protein
MLREADPQGEGRVEYKQYAVDHPSSSPRAPAPAFSFRNSVADGCSGYGPGPPKPVIRHFQVGWLGWTGRRYHSRSHSDLRPQCQPGSRHTPRRPRPSHSRPRAPCPPTASYPLSHPPPDRQRSDSDHLSVSRAPAERKGGARRRALLQWRPQRWPSPPPQGAAGAVRIRT